MSYRLIVVYAMALAATLTGQPPQAAAPPHSNREAPANYVLGPDDQITIQAPDAEELSGKAFRIDMRGNVMLPMIGRMQAAGLTTDDLEAQIKSRLKRYLQEPDVIVSITGFRSQPISILGAVTNP